MNADILIVRESNRYRILHGHLHLANELSRHDAIVVDVKGEGEVKIIRTRQGYVADPDNQRLPVLEN